MRYTKTALLGAVLASWSFFAMAEDLTVERIFAAPDLSGPRLRQPKFSPDGRYITYLQGKADNKDQLDLWGFDTRNGKARLLVDSKAFISGPERLSAEEEARRERQRTASLSGIVDYEFSADGKKLLVPLNGDLYIYNLGGRGSSAVRRLTYTQAYETDARFSPEGRYVSFIRDQNLFVIDLATAQERAVTTDGGGLIQNGVAEFVAQEEMDRNTGYWWSPDEKRIAFTRIDDSSVTEIERFEINATGAKAIRQRYPAAGSPNTRVELKVVELSARRIISVDLGIQDGYLARLNWFPDSRRLVVQRQTRDQKQLDLVRVDAASGATKVLLTETSKHWIDLHNDLQFLKQREAFIWGSRRNGFKHLYLYDFEGKLIRPLTEGPWMVVGDGTESGLVGIDEVRGKVYFMANEASVLERQLYVTSLDTTTPYLVQRISLEPGWHDARLLPGGQRYLDVWSSPDQPPTASLRALDGSTRGWLVRNLLDSSHPFTRYSTDRVKEQFGSIRARDGQELFYRFIPPAKMVPGKRYPAIVDVYGGPHNQYVRKDWMGGARAAQGYFRQVLAQRGFAVISLDNRGSGFRGDAFDAAIAGRLGKVEIEDQLLGVDFLKQQSFIDPKRIGIMGWSYGGYMTLMGLMTTDAFKAGVAGAPVTDWRLYDTHYTERYLGMPTVGTAYEDSSVLKNAGALRGSLLLVHGLADDNVLFTHSTLLMQRLQAMDKPFDVMTYPGGKHGLIRAPQTGQHFYNMVVRFFERELKE